MGLKLNLMETLTSVPAGMETSDQGGKERLEKLRLRKRLQMCHQSWKVVVLLLAGRKPLLEKQGVLPLETQTRNPKKEKKRAEERIKLEIKEGKGEKVVEATQRNLKEKRKKLKGIRIRKLEGEGGKGEKVVEVMQRNLKGRRKKLKGIRIRKLEGEGGKGEKVAKVTQRNLKGRRKNLEGIRRKGGKEERKVKITGVNQKKEKETGKTRNLHQRRKIMEEKGRGEMVVEMEEIMVWQNQLTTSFGVLIFHWSR